MGSAPRVGPGPTRTPPPLPEPSLPAAAPGPLSARADGAEGRSWGNLKRKPIKENLKSPHLRTPLQDGVDGDHITWSAGTGQVTGGWPLLPCHRLLAVAMGTGPGRPQPARRGPAPPCRQPAPRPTWRDMVSLSPSPHTAPPASCKGCRGLDRCSVYIFVLNFRPARSPTAMRGHFWQTAQCSWFGFRLSQNNWCLPFSSHFT